MGICSVHDLYKKNKKMNDKEQLSGTNFYILNDTNTPLLYKDLASNATVTVPVNKTKVYQFL